MPGDNNKKPSVMFLIGAGASKPFGVPTNKEFAKAFEKEHSEYTPILRFIKNLNLNMYEIKNKSSIDNLSKNRLWMDINFNLENEIEYLSEEIENYYAHIYKEQKIKESAIVQLKELKKLLSDLDSYQLDLESLLEAIKNLTNLGKKANDMLLLSLIYNKIGGYHEYPFKRTSLEHPFLKSHRLFELIPPKDLKINLENFIIEKCQLTEKKKKVAFKIYEKLFELYNGFEIKIATTNYDTIIEDVFSQLKIKIEDNFNLVDGFILDKIDGINKWVGNFKEQGIPLFKLHGSISWYSEGAWGDIIKIPSELQISGNGVITYKDKKLKKRFIYPTETKEIHSPPFNKIYIEFANTLDNINQCIAIGHNFNDIYIKNLVDSRLKDEKFKLIIVSPSASKIKTKFINQKNIKIHEGKNGKFESWVNKSLNRIKNKNELKKRKLEELF